MKIRIDNRMKNHISFISEEGVKLKVTRFSYFRFRGMRWEGFWSINNIDRDTYKEEFLSIVLKRYIKKYPSIIRPLIKALNNTFQVKETK